MQFIVGIDVAKRNHESVIMDEEGMVVQKTFSFPNSCAGYNRLLEFVGRVMWDRAAVSFGMESTGHYWLFLYARLTKEGYRVHVINPIQSDALRGIYIRQAKTDPRDSFIIADVIHFGRFSETTVSKEKFQALRELCRNRFFMVDSVSDVKRKPTALIDRCFPEYEAMFSNLFVETSVAVLAKYPTPKKLSHANLTALTGVLQNASGGRFGQGKALELRGLSLIEQRQRFLNGANGIEQTAAYMQRELRQIPCHGLQLKNVRVREGSHSTDVQPAFLSTVN